PRRSLASAGRDPQCVDCAAGRGTRTTSHSALNGRARRAASIENRRPSDALGTAVMSYDGSDTVILCEEVAYQDVLPVAWRPLGGQIDPDLAASYTASNVRVLEACTALQEQGQVEKADENNPHSADFLRIELKINLLLDVVGRILAANQ